VQAEFDRRDIRISLVVPPTRVLAEVCASEVALATINLLRNAMEAFVEPADGAVVSVQCRRPCPDWIEILVVDNGRGLSPEAILTAFGAFQTTKETGAGIGLSICQEVAEHHSGSISLEANPAGGLTATLRLATKHSES
jgi:signal transduction histidine kinase